MPQFCLLFYAILQSWRPKGGKPWHNAPPKYAPGYHIIFFKYEKETNWQAKSLSYFLFGYFWFQTIKK